MGKRTPLAERFWAKVRKTETCWLWTGALYSNGYGAFGIKSDRDGKWRPALAHRIAYELETGPIPDSLTLDHLCRVRRCVRPSHLEPVTIQMNLLRGDTPQGINARKTHCGQGHPLSGDNLYVDPSGKRHCRICRAATRQRYWQNNRERALEAQRASQRRRRASMPRRGNANARKTHCPKDHPYDEQNTVVRPNGSRVCRICLRDSNRLSRERSKGR